MIGDVREPLPVRPKSPVEYDYEHTRNGTVNLFLAYESLTGTQRVEVTERKANADFARLLRRIAAERFPQADRITLVVDDLSSCTGTVVPGTVLIRKDLLASPPASFECFCGGELGVCYISN